MGGKELEKIIQVQHVNKQEKKLLNARDRVMATARYNYETPPLIFWNQVELKVRLTQIAKHFGIKGDVEIDNGTAYSYGITMYFPTKFQEQVIQS